MPWRSLYSAALYLLMPAVLLRLLWRSRAHPGYRRGLPQRFGFVPRLQGRPAWFHAVSVGETLAAVPLIQEYRRRHPQTPVLVTTMTPTGSDRVRAAFGDAVAHVYLPYDLPGAVARFLDRAQPRLGVLMETELWPNLLAAARQRGIPMALLNARLSARSARGYARVANLLRPALDDLALVSAQTRADARRFRCLGLAPCRLRVLGSIKFDQQVPPGVLDRGRRLRQALGAGRPVWIAASTHAGEEQAALEAHRRLRETLPQAGLVLVPRHPERFDAVAELCARQGFPPARRSTGAAPGAAAVYLGDTMGELPLMLAAADVAFVGGSLVPRGGHNLLEPAALGLPVLTGPHTFNFHAIHRLLERGGGCRTVNSAQALAVALSELLGDRDRRLAMGEAACQVVARHRGSRERMLEALETVERRAPVH